MTPSRQPIRKGDTVRLLPEWQDEADGEFQRIALADEDGGHVLVVVRDPAQPDESLCATETLLVEWLEA